jgi:predicted dehydrogenase
MVKARFAKAKDIKAAVVGYGGAFNMGQKHLEEMKKAGMAPTAVVDVDADRLAIAEKDFPGIETYTSVSAMLKGSDANLIVIITPHNTHARLSLQCLRAGRSVVVEKPMAVTTAECDRMIAEARKQGVLLSTYHNRHWDGCILRAVREIAQKGVIGEVFRIDAHMTGYRPPRDWWRSSRSISGGILYDWGVHLLEYSLQLLDGELVEVAGFNHTGFWTAQSAWGEDTNEDEALAVARFDTGKWITLHMSSLDSAPKQDHKRVAVTGTKGTYLFDNGSWKTIIQQRNGTKEKEGQNPNGKQHLYYKNVCQALLGEEELVISPEWARRPIHIIDLAVKSAERGRTLKAKYA